MNLDLLTRFLVDYPFQPATALWRAAEIGHLLDKPFPSGRGLDLGCGDGLLTRIVDSVPGERRWTGIDPDPAEVEAAAALGFYDRVYRAGGDDLDEPDASFDFVFSNSVLEHIPELDPVSAEVTRVLRPGGVYIATVPGPGFHHALRGPLLRRGQRERHLATLDRRLAHYRYWSAEEWRAHLEPHGLELVETTTYLSRTEIRRWETIARCTSGLLYSLFSIVGRRRQPIEIQRTLGMRRKGLRMPRFAAAALARILAFGTARGGEPPSGLRFVARKL